ncbi:hypothetical protein [Paraliomyxa miuraensis]|uniref:hypothetical protein n=1 Tax=Paraliomyxa miuraensis TaxID=376150 RepID=UPI0022502A44|nr:hypothetical protein [Paraliomyxa miuraensis]MCX4247956.1 hypothetical protein [Paraliomyxa miuraensis]
MRRVIITAAVLVSLGVGCEPEPQRDPEPPGTLEYGHPHTQIFRLDRRIDIIGIKGDDDRRECGILSERAHTELQNTLSALDPHADHGHDPNDQSCAPGAFVYIEGFEHSPFACDFQCCGTELARAALIYSLIELHFEDSGPLVFDGEPYIAIEPDTPCP